MGGLVRAHGPESTSFAPRSGRSERALRRSTTAASRDGIPRSGAGMFDSRATM